MPRLAPTAAAVRLPCSCRVAGSSSLWGRAPAAAAAAAFGASSRSFVDVAWIAVRAGDGGGGAATFGRGKNKRVGPPDGGDGGAGGSAYIVCDAQRHDLALGRKHFRAQSGTFGKSQKRHGRAGDDLRIDVPCGTVVRAFPAEHRPHLHKDALPLWTAELDEDGAELLVAKGGAGGVGNLAFVSGAHRSPLERVEGEEGENYRLQLELKLIADIGLVGFPNAGKSSLLAALSRASPKIANYPFTTLTPNIGMVPLSAAALNYMQSLQQQAKGVAADTVAPRQQQLCIADIPGLVEGAHQNIGLGHSFLRHVERSAGLVYVLDAAGASPW
jgi:GTPase